MPNKVEYPSGARASRCLGVSAVPLRVGLFRRKNAHSGRQGACPPLARDTLRRPGLSWAVVNRRAGGIVPATLLPVTYDFLVVHDETLLQH